MMKKTFIILSALMVLFACTSENPVEEESEVYHTSDVDHHLYQVGFLNADLGNSYDTNSYTAIALGEQWRHNWSFIPDIVKQPDIRRIVHSYDTEEYYTISGKRYYYTVTHNYHAYYSAIVEWDSYVEYKEYRGITQVRNVSKNLKCTVQYVGCTKGTPSQYIPSEISPQVTTYPDSEDEWVNISSGGSGTDSSSPGGDTTKREYSYHCSTICYNESGEPDKLYIYKSDFSYRASFIYESKGVDKIASLTIHTNTSITNGAQFKYYVTTFGIPWYFNFTK